MGRRWWLSVPQRERMGSHCHCFVIRLVFWLFSQSLFPGCSEGWGIFSIFLLLLGLARNVWFTLGCLETKKSLDRHKWRKTKGEFLLLMTNGVGILRMILMNNNILDVSIATCAETDKALFPFCAVQESMNNRCIVSALKTWNSQHDLIARFFGTEDVFDVQDKFFLARWELPTFFCLSRPCARCFVLDGK